MALVTLVQLREYLNQVPSGGAPSSLLQSILPRAESIVVEALGFSFFENGTGWDDVEASAKRVRSEQSVHLRLPPYKYGSLVSVYPLDGLRVGSVAVAPDVDYEETESHFYLYRPDGWGGLRYEVTAKWGYGPAPENVVQLILELAVNIWRSRDQGSFQTSQGVDTLNNAQGGGVIKYVGGLNADQRRIIQTVRRKYIELVH